MSDELLEIEPLELKFTVEVKKQSSCSVRLFNKSNKYVAFKVKTTSPKKYCVRPNTGIIQPKSTSNFTIIMQGPRVPPSDMISRDKFLVQSTIVAVGTAEEDITSSMFVKDNNNYVEERKLRVILISPPNSPVLSPLNGAPDQFATYDSSLPRDQVFQRKEDISPQLEVTQDILEDAKPIASTKALDLEHMELVKDAKNLKEKISELETKLKEAQETTSKLTEERRLITQDCESLQQELVQLRSKKVERRVQVGFPFLYLCMVALISAFLGYLSRCR